MTTPDIIRVAGVLVVFLALAGFMYTGRLPALLALPIMAVLVAIIGGVSANDIVAQVLGEGTFRLAEAMMAAMLGSMLAAMIEKSGVAESMIKRAAELGGDSPLVMGVLLALVVFVLFIALSGLGAVVMVATIVFPILLSLGLPPLLAGALFLIAMSAGGVLNVQNWQLYLSLFGEQHLTQSQILAFAVPLAGVMMATAFAFLFIEWRRLGRRRLWAERPLEPAPAVRWWAYLTPIVPLAIVLVSRAFHYTFSINAALVIGLAYGAAANIRRGPGGIQLLSRSAFDGIANVAPAIALMIGIGMVLKALSNDQVIALIRPALLAVVPRSLVGFIALFAVIAPLALYRGPLNLFGMGSGLVAALWATGAISAPAIMVAFLAVGQLQGVCDPTNTHNVWIANHLGVDVQQVLRRTLPYVWIAAVMGLVIGGLMYLRG
jgi:Na+/H+ antiporter NhaD/arsenite permease-like protein